MVVNNLTNTTWRLNRHITNTVPNGTDYQHLFFNFYLDAILEVSALSNLSPVVGNEYLQPFSTWEQLVVQLPQLLTANGATNITSTFDASSLPTACIMRFTASECEFLGNSGDGYWFSPNATLWSTYSPAISGNISFTLDGDTYNDLSFAELIEGIEQYLGMPFFDYTGITIYDINDGFAVDGMRTWTITGGIAVTDSNLISWLQENAVRILPEIPVNEASFNAISYDAANKLLKINNKYYKLASTASGDTVSGTSFSSISLDSQGVLSIDGTNISLPVYSGTYTIAKNVSGGTAVGSSSMTTDAKIKFKRASNNYVMHSAPTVTNATDEFDWNNMTLSLSNPTGNATASATFTYEPPAKPYYNISVDWDPSDGSLGTATTSTDKVPVDSDESVTLTASEAAGIFSHWIIDGKYNILEGSIDDPVIIVQPKSDICATACFGVEEDFTDPVVVTASGGSND